MASKNCLSDSDKNWQTSCQTFFVSLSHNYGTNLALPGMMQINSGTVPRPTLTTWWAV